MLKLQFNYPQSLASELCDTHTYCASIDLYVRGIHTQQLDAHTLVFESARDRTYAVLLLSASTVYTVEEL
jgi:hypothetical protein